MSGNFDKVTDEELVSRFKSGDHSSFINLVDRYKKGLYGMFYRVLRNQADAEDLTQEVFLKAYINLNGFREESSFKTWLYRIGINLASNFKKSGRYNREILDNSLTEFNSKSQPVFIKNLIEKDQTRLLSKAIKSLPTKQRVTLSLRIDKELKNHEIAEILDCPIGTVKANLFHAINNLREKFKKMGINSFKEL